MRAFSLQFLNPLFLLISFLLAIVLVFFGNFWLSAMGVALCFYNTLYFISILGKTFPIMELVALIASYQWILGAYFDYRIDLEHFRYVMRVPEEEYMRVVVPITFCYQVAIFYQLQTVNITAVYNRLIRILRYYYYTPYILIGIGIGSSYLSEVMPKSVEFIFYLFTNLKYVGLIYLFFKGEDLKNWVFWLIMGVTLTEAIQKAVFHDFILWGVILFGFLVVRFRWSLFMNVVIILLGVVFLALLQSVKENFRTQLSDNRGSEVELFVNLMSDEIQSQESLLSRKRLDYINVRLNQGWIISAIINNIPRNRGYDHGESIKEAVISSFMPRIFFPDKKTAGGHDNFRKFTGLPKRRDTSMGTSILGEAYANYGSRGAMVFMAIWGFLMTLFYKYLIRISTKYPTFILWVPIIFLHAFKAETELIVVLNHLAKSALIFVFLFEFIHIYVNRRSIRILL